MSAALTRLQVLPVSTTARTEAPSTLAFTLSSDTLLVILLTSADLAPRLGMLPPDRSRP